MTRGSERQSQRAEEVRAEIERTREKIAASAEALRHEVAVHTDWREWVRRKPIPWFAGAFAAGFFIARRWK